MITKELVNSKKNGFAEKYMSDEPESLAIVAAVQHGYLYTSGLSKNDRKKVRKKWAEKLMEIGELYKEKRSFEDFKNDILALREYMNREFPNDYFQRSNEDIRKGYESGFRIAHAQKSLSIYLKHCWCRRIIKPVPPVCPIDGNVLGWVHINQAWTKCNSIDDKDGIVYSGYESQFERLVKTANDEASAFTVFEWELCKWRSDAEKRSEYKVKTEKPRTKQSAEEASLNVDSLVNDTLSKWREKYDCTFNGENKPANGKPLIYTTIKINDAVYHIFVGQDNQKSYCEILPLGNVPTPLIDDGFERKGGKKPYLIKGFSKDSIANAIESMAQLLDRYANNRNV